MNPMNDAPNAEVALLHAALELPEAERPAYLDHACAGDPALRQQVEALLRAHAQADDFLEQPLLPGDVNRDATETLPTAGRPGERIGRYKLLQQIGEGGCGIVYMAEQEEPVRRRVALKIIKLGMDTKQVIARFEAERQALALMEHPNIARVLDAGATDSGRPFFVMELVRGIKITDYCDENKVSTEDRLKLFIQVCQAIQHAHQKGVIHRDIKPSNILVTINDGVPVPKVIDFGIAKATQGRLTDRTLFTAFEQFIGTPAYMSPEQAVLTSLDIDTRSDIYSLGVLLYELLTGRTPFDQNELLAAGLDEMRRTIREMEPLRPSTRLNTMEADALTTTARLRHTDPPRLIHVIRGDLDWIVMKCLEKDRARRYETANGLAADIGRYLRNELVVARPPSRWYSFQKLARRNQAALITTGSVGLALVLAVVVLANSNMRIRDEQTQKEAALAVARKSEFEAKEQLFASLKSQGEARRYSRRIGQRVESLAALSEAAKLRRDEDLRDAAIAALALPDLRLGKPWQAFDTNYPTFDDRYQKYARIDSQSIISIHTVPDGQEIQRFPSGPVPLHRYDRDRTFYFSPDGRLLAKFDKENCWSVWRVDTGQVVLRTPSNSSFGFTFSHDSTQIATHRAGNLMIFDLESGKERNRWSYKTKPHALEFSPDKRQLAAGSLGPQITIFDAEQGKLLKELPTPPQADRALAWHPSGKYLAVSAGNRMEFWDVIAGAKVSTLEGHAQQVSTVSLHPSGNWLISDSWDGEPRLWQPSPARESMRFFSGRNRLRFSQDGRWAGVNYPGDGKAQLIEFIPSQIYHTFFGSLNDSQNSFSLCSVSPNGRLLAASSVGVSIRELPSGRELAMLPIEYAHKTLFHPNGRELLISGATNWLEVWPLAYDSAAATRIRFGPPRKISLPFIPYDFALAADGRTLAITDPYKLGGVRLLDLPTGILSDAQFELGMADGVAVSPDGQWVAASGWKSPEARLWNARTGECVLSVPGNPLRVAFSMDGRELVVSTSQAFVFYNVKTQKIIRRLERQASMHPGFVTYSSDCKLMAMEISPGVFRLSEAQTGRTIAHLQDPNGNVSIWIGFSPDGTQLLAGATYERAIHRWDLRALRVELKAMDLDWDWPEFPPAPAGSQNPPPIEVEVVSGEAR